MKTKLEILQEKQPELILAFHIGRGGRFHNSGHLSFLDECTINRFVDDLFINSDGTQYTDGNGREVGLSVLNDGTGKIDIDGDYDTTYAVHIQDLTKSEFDAIKNRGSGFFGLSMDEFNEIISFEEEEEEDRKIANL